MRKHSLFLAYSLILATFLSCEKGDKPSSQEGTVIVNGIELSDGENPDSKINAELSWEHLFSNELTLSFISSESGEKFELPIDQIPQNSENQIILPIGNYTVTSNQNAGIFSDFLPISINEQISVIKGTQEITPKAQSDYGLVTVAKKNIAAAELVNPSGFDLEENEEVYYGYFRDGENLKIQIAPQNTSNSFRQTYTSSAFSHQHFAVSVSSDPDDVDLIIPGEFILDQEVIDLTSSGLPVALSPRITAELPTSQDENSGLAVIENRLFSINDGGNSNELFELDPETGEVLRTILINDAENTDWEDLAVSDSHLFIGDFGNNQGSRQDLKIYTVPIASLLNSEEASSEAISFSFSDQIDFSASSNNTNFDCEAMVYWQGELHLFSKNWVDDQTKHYTLPSTPGAYQAQLASTFNSKGLITAAAINENGELGLLGYENSGLSSRSFLWLFSDFGSSDFFTRSPHQLVLGSPAQLSQTEGLEFKNGSEVWIAGERINLGGLTVPAKISQLDLTGLF